MKVFISWSGARSLEIANAMRDWLPNLIQDLQPWMSATDIESGARWNADIADQLAESRVGIVCLTPENLREPWLLFEAGAISKTLEETFVIPYLFEVEPSDLPRPLGQFQARRANKEDSRKLFQTINRARRENMLSEDRLNKAFEVWWPHLDGTLKAIQPALSKSPPRAERELLEEILETVRSLARSRTSPDSAPEQAILHTNENSKLEDAFMQIASNVTGNPEPAGAMKELLEFYILESSRRSSQTKDDPHEKEK